MSSARHLYSGADWAFHTAHLGYRAEPDTISAGSGSVHEEIQQAWLANLSAKETE
jgi:hypothetical protein